jgi:hypothetical protein
MTAEWAQEKSIAEKNGFKEKGLFCNTATVPNRVARWFGFKPKIPVWVNFGGSCNGKSWSIL